VNIAIISDFNIAGIPTYLWKAINKYTEHKARCIVAYDDSFQYDKDIILNSVEARREASDWVKQCEFFHFGRGIFNWEGVDWNDILNVNNCCIEYYGSELRNGWERIVPYHAETGITAITGTDWTITGRMTNSFYHLAQYLTKFGDMSEDQIPLCESWNGTGRFRIATSSAGSPIKGYDVLGIIVNQLQEEGVPVEVVSLMELSNAQVLERKLDCHATFTSIHGGWGMSGIESMYLGHPILCSLDPWVMSLFPENPTVIISRANLKDSIRCLVESPHIVKERGLASRDFAIRNFKTTTILKRYLYLWDLIMNKELVMEGGHLPTKIYKF
jgi:hypothetical protein